MQALKASERRLPACSLGTPAGKMPAFRRLGAFTSACCSLTRVSELGEFLAEFGVGDGDGPCAASAGDIAASVIANRIEFRKFFILSPGDLLNVRELLLEVFDLLFVLARLSLKACGGLLCLIGRGFCLICVPLKPGDSVIWPEPGDGDGEDDGCGGEDQGCVIS